MDSYIIDLLLDWDTLICYVDEYQALYLSNALIQCMERHAIPLSTYFIVVPCECKLIRSLLQLFGNP